MDKTIETDVPRVDVDPVNRKETRSLYKKRVKIHPMRVTGRFRRLKWGAMAITLAIYYLTPWIRWDRGAGAPDQAVLIDFPGRRFYFFFIEIWPQEVYYITGLLIMAALGLFLVTTVAGRAWCGYSCPQTVWTDLFIAVERLIEGDRNERRRLDAAPWFSEKIAKRAIKFAIWLIIGLCTGGAWIFYFADAPTLMGQLLTFSAPPIAVASVGTLTATTFVLGGFAREQVCIYMCPWPRIQAAMMDEDSLIVDYRDYRGEPRAPHRKGDGWEGRGDCVDCNRCVSVCPAGIDIRDGQQLECISCALCIDACNEVMTRVGRPQGLIAYDTLVNRNRVMAGLEPEIRLIRPRTVVYGTLWVAVGLLMLWVLLHRPDVEVNVLHDRNPLFVALSDGSIRNGYTVKVLNKAAHSREFTITVDGLSQARVAVVGESADGTEVPILIVERDRIRSFRVLVAARPDGPVGESTPIVLTLWEGGRMVSEYEGVFRGPAR